MHILYFILSLLFAVFQRQLFEGSLAFVTPYIFPVPFLVAGDLFYLLIHAGFTVYLVHHLNRKRFISGEVAGAVIFGCLFPVLNTVVSHLLVTFTGRLTGSVVQLSYSIFRQKSEALVPLRAIAFSLLLVAIGMSLYSKLSNRKPPCINKQGIVNLLWGSLGIDLVFFIAALMVIVFQNELEYDLRFNDISYIRFSLPFAFIIESSFLLFVHLILTVTLARQLKRGDRGIWYEMLGIFLYSGIMGWLYSIINHFFYIRISDMDVLLDISLINEMLSYCLPVFFISTSLFMLCCGMSIFKKINCTDD